MAHTGLTATVLGMPEAVYRTRETTMAGLMTRIKSMMRSPKGQQLTTRAREMAKDPSSRRRATEAVQRFRRKR